MTHAHEREHEQEAGRRTQDAYAWVAACVTSHVVPTVPSMHPMRARTGTGASLTRYGMCMACASQARAAILDFRAEHHACIPMCIPHVHGMCIPHGHGMCMHRSSRRFAAWPTTAAGRAAPTGRRVSLHANDY